MAVKITAAALRTIAPGAAPSVVEGIVQNQHLLARYGIDSPQLVKHFLGQIACETVGFTRLEENLFYTTASRVCAVWPSRFPTEAAARPFLRNPEKLANSVYANRLGNGDPASGDGWKFRGSGCKQTTGRTNFGVVEKVTALPVTKRPEMLRRFPEALESACIYWQTNDLGRYAKANDIVGLTKAIQGGAGGLADRRIYTERAGRVKWQGSAEFDDAPPAVASTDPWLRRGAKGAAVREAQRLLAAHGYEIRIDGDFGDGTDNVVREFQEDHGLMADGTIGPVTWEALRAASSPASRPPSEPKAPAAPAAPQKTTLVALIAQFFAAILDAFRKGA